jgi:predicted methyltransferase
MNAAIHAALKPGGIYAVVDHSAAEGAGLNAVKTLHRIEESVLREEIEAAGFELAGEADFLRNAGDTRDWSASPSAAGDKRGTSDRFVLKFVRR